MKRGRVWLAVVVAALVFSGVGQTAAASDPPAIVVGADGETAPVFSYADAIRERVFIPVAGVDLDADGVGDRVATDIVRPRRPPPGKVPVIIDASPYYTSLGRGNESSASPYDSAGVPTSSRCSTTTTSCRAATRSCWSASAGRPGPPVAGRRRPGRGGLRKAVIDWLTAGPPGSTPPAAPWYAGWSTGAAAMIGKS